MQKISRGILLRTSIVVVTMGVLVVGCGAPKKIDVIRTQRLSATLALSRNEIEEERKVIQVAKRDTLTVKDDKGNDVLIMKAVKDEASGEMVATEVLDAAVITARFRNVMVRLTCVLKSSFLRPCTTRSGNSDSIRTCLSWKILRDWSR